MVPHSLIKIARYQFLKKYVISKDLWENMLCHNGYDYSLFGTVSFPIDTTLTVTTACTVVQVKRSELATKNKRPPTTPSTQRL